MNWIAQYLLLIPAVPPLAAGLIALMKQPNRRLAAALAIGAMTISLALSCLAFAATLGRHDSAGVIRAVQNFPWFQIGESTLQLGWVLDPLAAIMLVMV